jgi:DNA-binding NarL/FixJ family response regulator
METTRILLADDHTIVREGVRALLEARPGFKVVGEVSTGLEAVEMISKEEPDVVLMDIAMPGLNGLDATRQVMQGKIKPKIVILSMHAISTYAIRALRNGAVGYLLKDADEEEIYHVIDVVMAGKRYITPAMSEEIPDVSLLDGEAGDGVTQPAAGESPVL